MSTSAENSKKIAQYALDNVGGPYIFGGTAKECTPSYRRARINQYPEYEAKITKNCPVLSGKQSTCDGCKYQGKKAHDCAQLTRYAAQAAGLTLPSGATSQWNKGDWALKGEIGTLPRGVVSFVYKESGGKMQHTGIYLGDGTVADSRGHDYGVLHKSVDSYKWTHWAILNGMELPSGVFPDKIPDSSAESQDSAAVQLKLGDRTLSKGCKGDDVKELQEALNKLPCIASKLTVDGDFGTNTARAVYTFQTIYEIKVDSKYGPESHKTLMAALEALEKREDSSPAPQEPSSDPEQIPTKKVVTIVSERKVNLRSGDSTKAGRVTQVVGGTQLEYVTTINGWHGVRWKNRIVWVSGEFSKVSEA